MAPVFYFQTDCKRPEEPGHRHRHAQAGQEELEGDRPRGDGHARRRRASSATSSSAATCKDAKTAVKVFELDGKFVRDVELPGIGTAGRLRRQAHRHRDVLHVHQLRHAAEHLPLRHRPPARASCSASAKVKFDPAQYEVKQVFYPSKDGTKVPMFIAHKKGIKLDGTNPTLLYGYGGFNISLTPAFSVSAGCSGWRWAASSRVANLRGGGEYGEDWHRAGTKLQKQNVFDDFIAAAEWLIEEKYTQPEQARDPGRQQRRPARRRVHDAAARPVRRVPAGRRRDGHAPLPEVHRRPLLGGRLRLVATTPRSSRRCYEYSPYHNLKPGDEVPGDAGDDGRHRRPRGAGAQLQVRRGAAGRARRATRRC